MDRENGSAIHRYIRGTRAGATARALEQAIARTRTGSRAGALEEAYLAHRPKPPRGNT